MTLKSESLRQQLIKHAINRYCVGDIAGQKSPHGKYCSQINQEQTSSPFYQNLQRNQIIIVPISQYLIPKLLGGCDEKYSIRYLCSSMIFNFANKPRKMQCTEKQNQANNTIDDENAQLPKLGSLEPQSNSSTNQKDLSNVIEKESEKDGILGTTQQESGDIQGENLQIDKQDTIQKQTSGQANQNKIQQQENLNENVQDVDCSVEDVEQESSKQPDQLHTNKSAKVIQLEEESQIKNKNELNQGEGEIKQQQNKQTKQKIQEIIQLPEEDRLLNGQKSNDSVHKEEKQSQCKKSNPQIIKGSDKKQINQFLSRRKESLENIKNKKQIWRKYNKLVAKKNKKQLLTLLGGQPLWTYSRCSPDILPIRLSPIQEHKFKKLSLVWVDRESSSNNSIMQSFKRQFRKEVSFVTCPEMKIELLDEIFRESDTQFVFICSNSTFREVFFTSSFPYHNCLSYFIYCMNLEIAKSNIQLFCQGINIFASCQGTEIQQKVSQCLYERLNILRKSKSK